jgi:hypothetical protein
MVSVEQDPTLEKCAEGILCVAWGNCCCPSGAEPATVRIRQQRCSASHRAQKIYADFDVTTDPVVTNPADAVISAGCASAQAFAKAARPLPNAGEDGARAPNFTRSALASLSTKPRSYARNLMPIIAYLFLPNGHDNLDGHYRWSRHAHPCSRTRRFPFITACKGQFESTQGILD